MKHLITLALGGMLGVCLLASDASACHKSKCGGGMRTTCYQPAVNSNCGGGHRANKCGGCHKKMNRCTCAAPVMACGYGYAYPTYASYQAPMATGQHMGTPQATGQYMTTPHAPGKAMGSVQH